MSIVEIVGTWPLIGIGLVGSLLFMLYFINQGEYPEKEEWQRATVAGGFILLMMLLGYVLSRIIQ